MFMIGLIVSMRRFFFVAFSIGCLVDLVEQKMQSKAMSQGSAIGQIESLKAYAAALKKRWVHGVNLISPHLSTA